MSRLKPCSCQHCPAHLCSITVAHLCNYVTLSNDQSLSLLWFVKIFEINKLCSNFTFLEHLYRQILKLFIFRLGSLSLASQRHRALAFSHCTVRTVLLLELFYSACFGQTGVRYVERYVLKQRLETVADPWRNSDPLPPCSNIES
jgi:hypothetical protein